MAAKALVICNTTIFTGTPDRPWATALGLANGRVAAVGTEAQVRAVLPSAETVELPGRLVCPGLTDAHCHFVNFGESLLWVDLRNLASLEACRERIREAGIKARPGAWILGRNWNHNLWQEGREPDKRDLDDILPHNPAMMIRACGHSQWLNSKGLEAAGIHARTPDPPGGKFERDSSGAPTGLLREARRLVMASVPPPTREALKKAALLAQDQAVKSGLTRVHSFEGLAKWDALGALEQEGRLTIRVQQSLYTDELKEAVARGLTPGCGSDRLWTGQVKMYADGSLGAGTALMFAPYQDDPDNFGLPFFDLEKLQRRVSAAYGHGFGVAIHAIGDKAVANALDAIAWARRRHGVALRDCVEHIQLCRPADLKRFQSMGVAASVQPVFVTTDHPAAERLWGHERCQNAYLWKTIMEMGIRTQFGSDAPVEPIAPILGLQAAVLRQTPDLRPSGGWFAQQRLTLEQSLTGFTRTAAWTAGREDVLGQLEPGRLADLTVFEQDLTRTPPETWAGIGIEMTIIDGEVVYRR